MNAVFFDIFEPMLKRFYSGPFECGTDEAGRGCLAGPVTAAAVILPPDYHHKLLNDSKQLNTKTRELLRIEIEKEALCFGVASLSPKEIDELNILNASIEAMHQAISKLQSKPNFILVDGNRFKPYKSISHQCMVKGDARFLNIAAASVLAKTHRDEIMEKLGKSFPVYDWENNKGYPTKKHRKAIQEFGPSPHHRLSFKLLPSQLEFDY